VLAVGDERFQRKCLDRISQFQHEGRTIVIVSHAPDVLRHVCERAFVLENGQVIAGGEAADAVRIFREHLFAIDQVAAVVSEALTEPVYARVLSLGEPEILYPDAGSRPYLLPGEWLEVRLPYEGSQAARAVVFSLSVFDRDNRLVYGTDSKETPGVVDARGGGMVRFRFDSVPLLDGAYTMSFNAASAEGGRVYDILEQKVGFEVMNKGKESGSVAMAAVVEVAKGLTPILESESEHAPGVSH
jgi:ABC-2 type transport system ATP-binding protein